MVFIVFVSGNKQIHMWNKLTDCIKMIEPHAVALQGMFDKSVTKLIVRLEENGGMATGE